ncbi:oligosaccharide flippase family protein [Nocardia sp. 2]|uniref:Oligosaccharide flippase family protein n=1 Tax=Nocardia acididurans TaxID=2802282 RepID=A0ABS1M1H5_9NOCA|nr:oligosaccharide flippase family protein [Nocardia acididurans]
MAAAGTASVQIIALAQTLVLAHLLSPSEIGVFAAGTFLTAFVMVFSQSSLSQALIQRRTDIEDAAETVFWATLASGALLSGLLLATSPVLSLIFGSTQVGAVAAVSSGTVLLTSLLAVPDALMQRAFQFKRRIIVDPANALAFATVSITLAATGFGVWSMVAGYYAAVGVSVIAAWWLAGWLPFRGRFRVALWRELATFSLPLLIDGVVERAVEAAEVVIVGNRLDTAALGNYRNGRKLSFLPVVAIVQVCSYVLFPAFATIAGEPDRLKRGFLRALTWMWLAVVPASALLGATGEAVVVLLLGHEWRGAGQLVEVMAGVGMGFALMSVCAEAMKGAGRPHLLYWMSGVGALTMVPLLLILVHHGLWGVGLALSTSALATGLTGLILSRRVVGVSRGELARCLVPPLLAGVLAAVAVGLLEHMILHASERGVAAGLGLVVAEAFAFGVLYLGVLQLISPSSLAPVWSALRRA